MLEFALFPGVPDLAICLRFGCFLIWAPGADPGSWLVGFIRSGAPTHLRERARLISSGSSMTLLIRYPWRLKKLISWADNRFIVTNEADVGERLK